MDLEVLRSYFSPWPCACHMYPVWQLLTNHTCILLGSWLSHVEIPSARCNERWGNDQEIPMRLYMPGTPSFVFAKQADIWMGCLDGPSQLLAVEAHVCSVGVNEDNFILLHNRRSRKMHRCYSTQTTLWLVYLSRFNLGLQLLRDVAANAMHLNQHLLQKKYFEVVEFTYRACQWNKEKNHSSPSCLHDPT